MRAIIQLNDYNPEDGEPDADHGSYDPHHDPRSVVNEIETEWYHGGGNIHVTDPRVTQVAELRDGSVAVMVEEAGTPPVTIDNADLVTVHDEEAAWGGEWTNIGFKRISGAQRESGEGNRYVFKMPSGREVRLPPGTTVSELQNRI